MEGGAVSLRPRPFSRLRAGFRGLFPNDVRLFNAKTDVSSRDSGLAGESVLMLAV